MGYMFFVGCPGCTPGASGSSGNSGGGVTLPPPTGYTAHNTGQDAESGDDANWTIDENPAVIIPGDGPWNNAQPASHWISPSDNGASGGAGVTYSYTSTLTIADGVDPSDVVIRASVMDDNTLVEVLVNYVATGLSIPGNTNFASPTVLTLPSELFAPGENVVTFVVYDEGSITGLNVVWL